MKKNSEKEIEISKEEKVKKKDSSYWLPIGMCIGISIGTTIGAATNNLALWTSIGISIGLCFGVALSNNKDNGDKN